MSSNILYHLNELKENWRQQDFSYTREQKESYELLIQARRERVKSFYAEGRVSKGSKNTEV